MSRLHTALVALLRIHFLPGFAYDHIMMKMSLAIFQLKKILAIYWFLVQARVSFYKKLASLIRYFLYLFHPTFPWVVTWLNGLIESKSTWACIISFFPQSSSQVYLADAGFKWGGVKKMRKKRTRVNFVFFFFVCCWDDNQNFYSETADDGRRRGVMCVLNPFFLCRRFWSRISTP